MYSSATARNRDLPIKPGYKKNKGVFGEYGTHRPASSQRPNGAFGDLRLIVSRSSTAGFAHRRTEARARPIAPPCVPVRATPRHRRALEPRRRPSRRASQRSGPLRSHASRRPCRVSRSPRSLDERSGIRDNTIGGESPARSSARAICSPLHYEIGGRGCEGAGRGAAGSDSCGETTIAVRIDCGRARSPAQPLDGRLRRGECFGIGTAAYHQRACPPG